MISGSFINFIEKQSTTVKCVPRIKLTISIGCLTVYIYIYTVVEVIALHTSDLKIMFFKMLSFDRVAALWVIRQSDFMTLRQIPPAPGLIPCQKGKIGSKKLAGAPLLPQPAQIVASQKEEWYV